jgi:hypothetical protein
VRETLEAGQSAGRRSVWALFASSSFRGLFSLIEAQRFEFGSLALKSCCSLVVLCSDLDPLKLFAVCFRQIPSSDFDFFCHLPGCCRRRLLVFGAENFKFLTFLWPFLFCSILCGRS